MTWRDWNPARRWKIFRKDPPPAGPEGELTLLWSTNWPEEVSASLVFQGDGLDPDLITNTLGVMPVDIKRPGEEPEIAWKITRPEVGYWRVGFKRARESSIERELYTLINQLPSPGPEWDALKHLEGELLCALYLADRNRECYLGPEVTAAAAARHLYFRLDIYFEPDNSKAG